MSWVLALGGCGSAQWPDSGATPDTGTPALPDLTAAAVGAELEGALAPGLPEPWTPRDLYLQLLDAGDATCPGTDHLLSRPDFSCTSASGYTYYGVGQFFDLGTDDLEDWEMYVASFRITSPDGALFESAGTWQFTGGATGPWTGWVDGTIGHTPDDGWMGAVPSTALALSGTRDPGGSTLVLEGGVTANGHTAWFEGASTDDTTCAGTFAGTVRVRSTAGTWYRLEFGDSCAACAEVWLDTLDVGAACVDLSAAVLPMLAIRASP